MSRPDKGNSRDFGEDTDGSEHADHAVGDALRAPIEAAEAMTERVARLDQARCGRRPPARSAAKLIAGVNTMRENSGLASTTAI